MVTVLARSAPVMPGLASTRSSSRRGSSSTVETAARIAPCSLIRMVSARVPGTAMPGMPWALSSSSRLRRARQLEAILDGSRTT